MTREKFIATMKNLNLKPQLQDEILEFRNRLQTEEELATRGGAKWLTMNFIEDVFLEREKNW